ncbi:MAG: penicillin-binding protein 2 [Prolixibacteraceae bacterium]|nr:penicillin-binding protein 2 [Burkholderiales bacterium]
MNRNVELRDHQRELYYFQLRLAIVGSAVLFAFFLLLVRFFYVQVIQHEYYHTLAEQNRIFIVPVVPNRGLIVDRNGVVLAHNFAAYTLEITPSLVDDIEQTITNLSTLVAITPKDRKRFQKLIEEGHDFASIPIRTRLNDEEVARFAVNNYRFPGVEINARLFRHYPYGEIASHVVGYIGRISDNDVDELREKGTAANYSASDYIGKVGLEERYETELRGVTGYEHVETDANGKSVRTLRSILPVSGNNLTLALDARLQQIAEQAFGEHRGSMVAIEPSTGGVLALVSRPGFDPNLFVEGIDPQNWDALNNSPDHPLNNRALQGVYPPGSTFKPFMALAGLELGKRKASFTISDPGYFVLGGGGHVYRDWKAGGHGLVDLHKAIVQSCDTYFYGLAQELGIDAIHQFIGKFGFGKLTGIDIEGEVDGLLPSQEWKQRRFRQKWFVGDTISIGIGQGYNLTTPLQLAFATAILANDGRVFRPHVVKQIQNSQTDGITLIEPQPRAENRFSPENIKRVRDAMVDVTKPGGTAAWAGMNAKYLFAGKTGTAQVIGMKGQKYDEDKIDERHRDHALFIAYAPADDTKIALAILVENGGHGGSTAAPIARQVLDYYLLGKEPPPPKPIAVPKPIAAQQDGEPEND